MTSPKPTAALLKVWETKLREAGFHDIEDAEGQLKRDGRETQLHDNVVYEPLKYNRAQADSFTNSSSFARACQELCRHGNTKLTPELVASIWHGYCKGDSIRDIAKQLGLFRDIVHRAINKMVGLMQLLGEDVADTDITKIVLRGYDPGTDDPFIHSTWRNALFYDSERRKQYGEAGGEQFYRDTSRMIKALLSSPTTKVRVACLEDDPNEIAGYSVCSTTNLDWVYVKINYRKQGIATILCKGFKTVAKPRTPIGRGLVTKKKLQVINE